MPPETIERDDEPMSRLVQILAIAVTGVTLLGASALVPRIQAQREDLRLTLTAETPETVPPHVRIATAALGSFRGLAVDILWYRATQMKRAGHYYEANQLARWITTLQPQFAQVWTFHAWNMAYNISVATQTPDERWSWVQKGIDLLREKAVEYNPNSVRIPRELSWIFYHKVGKFADDMHWHYKRRLAVKWQELLGTPAVGVETSEALDRFRPVAEAPDRLRELLEKRPAVRPAVSRLQAMGYDLGEGLLRGLGRIRMLAPHTARLGIADDRLRRQVDAKLLQWWRDHESDIREPILRFLERKVLEGEYNMDPQLMLELMDRYGPLDWRHPAAHALYWGSRGTANAAEAMNKKEIDALNTYRQNIHSLQMLTRWGRISLDPMTGRIDMMPDPRFFPAYEKAVRIAEDALVSEGFEANARQSYEAGHENLLKQATLYSYLYGEPDQARAYYEKIRRLYGQDPSDRHMGRYREPLEEFVLKLLRRDVDRMEQASQFVDAMLRRAFAKGLANARPGVFNRFVDLARRIHERFQEEANPTPNAPQRRRALLPFDQLLLERYVALMRSGRISPLSKHRIWENTPSELKRRAYARIRGPLRRQFERAGLDPDRALPRPEGEIVPAPEPDEDGGRRKGEPRISPQRK